MKELFRNCLSVEECDGWYKPLRFTAGQYEEFFKVEGRRARSLAASSVRLSFCTAAEKIELRYRIGLKARGWASFDLLIDGALTRSISVSEDEGTVSFTLPADINREISIYLPHLVEVEIMAPVSDAPLYPTSGRDRLWLALGDSITQGMVAQRPSSAYPSVISELFGWEVINGGVGGIDFNSRELDYIGREPDIITVALGCNDWGRYESEELCKNVREYLDKLISLYECRSIHVILPIWRSDASEVKCGVDFDAHRQIIRRIAEEYPVSIIDGYELLPHDTSLYNDPSVGQIHPSDEGLMIYAFGLAKRLFDHI